MVRKSPTVRHRRLGRELRRLRETTDITPEVAATQLGWSRAKINRIENARTLPNTADVADACDLYGADSVTKAGLIQLCRDAGRRGWWTAYSDVFTGSYIALEAEAMSIRTWEPLLIPGILQTEGYARALFRYGRPDLSDSELDRRVSARMARKIALMGDCPLVLNVVIDEAVLRRPAGPGVMARQIDVLLEAATKGNVTVRVLPYHAGFHRGLEGAFSVLRFGEPDPDVGYVESPAGDVYVEAADQVRRLMLTFERLEEEALSAEESVAFIAAARSDHGHP